MGARLNRSRYRRSLSPSSRSRAFNRKAASSIWRARSAISSVPAGKGLSGRPCARRRALSWTNWTRRTSRPVISRWTNRAPSGPRIPHAHTMRNSRRRLESRSLLAWLKRHSATSLSRAMRDRNSPIAARARSMPAAPVPGALLRTAERAAISSSARRLISARSATASASLATSEGSRARASSMAFRAVLEGSQELPCPVAVNPLMSVSASISELRRLTSSARVS